MIFSDMFAEDGHPPIHCPVLNQVGINFRREIRFWANRSEVGSSRARDHSEDSLWSTIWLQKFSMKKLTSVILVLSRAQNELTKLAWTQVGSCFQIRNMGHYVNLCVFFFLWIRCDWGKGCWADSVDFGPEWGLANNDGRFDTSAW